MNFDFKKYQDLLGLMESDNNYNVINSSGYIGRYQFGVTTLNNLKRLYSLPGWKDQNYFRSNPDLQDKYLAALVHDSLNQISSTELKNYIGVVKSGRKRFPTLKAPVNVYGLLAAIHLSGAGNVRKYFKDGYDPDDGLTSLSDYLVYFSSKLNGSFNQSIFLLAIMSYIVLYYI